MTASGLASQTLDDVKGADYDVYEVIDAGAILPLIVRGDEDDGTAAAAQELTDRLNGVEHVLFLVGRFKSNSGREGACWKAAESDSLRERAQGDSPPRLTASATGPRTGLSDPSTYKLRPTYERVRN